MSVQFKDETHKETNFLSALKEFHSLWRKYENGEIKFYQLGELREKTFEKWGWNKAAFYAELKKRTDLNKMTG